MRRPHRFWCVVWLKGFLQNSSFHIYNEFSRFNVGGCGEDGGCGEGSGCGFKVVVAVVVVVVVVIVAVVAICGYVA